MALRRSYTVTRQYRLLREWQVVRRKARRPPVVVHQVGKVGSTAITQALKLRFPGGPIFHTHFLSTEGLAAQDQQYRTRFAETGIIHRHFLTSLCLRRLLDDSARRDRWRVVTLTRDPVARNLSAFFQTIQFQFPAMAERIQRNDASLSWKDVAALYEAEGWHDDPFGWFDREMQPVFGVDVFATPFPRERGWQIYEGPRADVLLIRVEDLEGAGTAAFEAFGIPGLQMSRHNVSEEKFYGRLYREVSRQLPLAGRLLALYGSPRMRHFYAEDEVARMRGRWTSAPATLETVPIG